VHDSWEAVLWVMDQGKEILGLDISKMATGMLRLITITLVLTVMTADERIGL
jgi:hypothetical protein